MADLVKTADPVKTADQGRGTYLVKTADHDHDHDHEETYLVKTAMQCNAAADHDHEEAYLVKTATILQFIVEIHITILQDFFLVVQTILQHLIVENHITGCSGAVLGILTTILQHLIVENHISINFIFTFARATKNTSALVPCR